MIWTLNNRFPGLSIFAEIDPIHVLNVRSPSPPSHQRTSGRPAVLVRKDGGVLKVRLTVLNQPFRIHNHRNVRKLTDSIGSDIQHRSTRDCLPSRTRWLVNLKPNGVNRQPSRFRRKATIPLDRQLVLTSGQLTKEDAISVDC